ncbi:MAG: imelysin family protein [Fodinibius sp.]|nr:imelysin family protein [Fodinibius sp.]
MITFNRFSTLIICIGLISVLYACSSSTSSEEETNFDRMAMLENYGQNLIIPAYDSLQQLINSLNTAANTFAETPTLENLAAVQRQLKQARLAWQTANSFGFGPAEMQTLRASLNTYPTDTTQINGNIESGSYTLGTIENQAAVGFPATGYLLHGVAESNEEIVLQYTADAYADNRTNYLLDNIQFIKEKVDAVTNEWKSSGGNYMATFASEENAGTDVGSSLGMLVNAMVLHYERNLRDGKVGIPSGVRSAGVPRPQATEAYYAGYSLELAIANTEAVQRLFLGTGLDGSEGPGLAETSAALNARRTGLTN